MNERQQRLHEQLSTYSQMAAYERDFVRALLLAKQPRKILEIGVASGAGTALILDALHDRPDAVLHSVDLLPRWYRDASRPTGFVAAELFPTEAAPGGRWQLHTGRDVAFVIETIGAGVDFCIIDTAHVHPVENLNFLAVLPFLTDGATVIVHDIAMNLDQPQATACNILFTAAVGEKSVPPRGGGLANIGAFIVDDETRRHAGNIVQGLSLPWATRVPAAVIDRVGALLRQHYPAEIADRYAQIVACERQLRRPVLPALSRLMAYQLERFPRLHAALRNVWIAFR